MCGGTVQPATGKIRAVLDFVRSRTKKQIRQFLGLTGYYRIFFPHFAHYSFHLSEATKECSPNKVTWNNDLEIEFKYLKYSLANSTSLVNSSPK